MVYKSRVPETRFQLGFQRMRHPRQIVRAALRVFGPQRQTDNRHIINALGFDDGLADAEVRRQPVGVGIELVVQPDDGVGARFADLELHGQHRHAGPRYRVDMLHAFDFRQHLLGGTADQPLHFPGGRAGKGMSTLAKVTLICGSSSRGVTSTANTPINNPTSASSGVISLSRNFLAIGPGQAKDGSVASLIFLSPDPLRLFLEIDTGLDRVQRHRSPASNPARISTDRLPSGRAAPAAG
jgi:hypothetical protein